jgi:DNA-binding NarL/FixJ family response regulator
MLDLNLRDGTRPRDNVSRLVKRGYKVLVVSVLADKEYVLTTLEAGAASYLTKSSKSTELELLVRTIREIAEGTHVLGQELAFLMGRDRRPNKPKLSHREEEVLKLYGQGLTLDTVAQRLGIQRSSAKRYLERAKEKYQNVERPFHNRTELQQRLREDNIDSPPPL